MTLIKYISLYFLLTTFLLSSPTLQAQETALQSPWIIGTELGLNLAFDCGSCRDDRSMNTTFSNAAFVHYRIKRWIGLSVYTNYNRQHIYEHRSLYDNDIKSNILFQRDTKVNLTTLSVGPKVMLRVGQGDLGLEVRGGRSIKTARVQAISQTGNAYDLKYKATFPTFLSVRLDYTYWPKQNFGITIGLESILDQVNRQVRGIGFGTPSYNLKTNIEEAYPDSNPDILQLLSPEIGQTIWNNLVIGISYRFK